MLPRAAVTVWFEAWVVLALLVIGRALYYLQLVERHNAQGYERHYQNAEGEEPA